MPESASSYQRYEYQKEAIKQKLFADEQTKHMYRQSRRGIKRNYSKNGFVRSKNTCK